MPRKQPPSPIVQHTRTHLRRLMREQAKRYFNSTPQRVLENLRSGKQAKTAAAANIAMLAGLLADSHE